VAAPIGFINPPHLPATPRWGTEFKQRRRQENGIQWVPQLNHFAVRALHTIANRNNYPSILRTYLSRWPGQIPTSCAWNVTTSVDQWTNKLMGCHSMKEWRFENRPRLCGSGDDHLGDTSIRRGRFTAIVP
jgi:hypothetical protein